jgi:hypothetical protein
VCWWLTSQITTQIQGGAHTLTLFTLTLSLSSIPLHTDSLPTSTLSFSPFSRYNPRSSLPIRIYSLLRRLQSYTRCIVSFFIPTSFLSFLCQSTTTRSFLQSLNSRSTLSLPFDRYNFFSESRYTVSSIALKTSSGRSLSGRVN